MVQLDKAITAAAKPDPDAQPLTPRQLKVTVPLRGLRRPVNPARAGWAKAASKIARLGDDALVMGEFGNGVDSELAW